MNAKSSVIVGRCQGFFVQRLLCVNGISHTQEVSGLLRATFAVCKWDKSYSGGVRASSCNVCCV